MARAQYLRRELRELLRDTANAENAAVLDLCESTGLRVGDVVALRTEQLAAARGKRGWLRVKEQKTGKSRSVRLTPRQMNTLEALCGSVYVFEGRRGINTHRNRSTVYKAMKRGAKRAGLPTDGVSPHSLRKVYAVELFRKTGSVEAVQKALQHDRMSTTLLYAMADKIHGKRAD